jgi:hypothetical protein
MTTPEARDRLNFSAIHTDLVLSWGHLPSCGTGAEFPWECTCDYAGRLARMEAVVATAEATGVRPPGADVLLNEQTAAGDVRKSHAANEWDHCITCRSPWPCDAEMLAELVMTRAILEAASGTPEPPACSVCGIPIAEHPNNDLCAARSECNLATGVHRGTCPLCVGEAETGDEFEEEPASPPATPGLPAELRALSEAATPGPWEAREQQRGEGARAFGVWLINAYVHQSGYPGAELYGVRADVDAALIVAAVNYVRAQTETPGEPE